MQSCKLASALCYALLICCIVFCSCAKQWKESYFSYSGVLVQKTDIRDLKGFAHVVAERDGIKWASNVAILAKRPGGIRIDLFDKLADVVSTISYRDNKGYIHTVADDKWEIVDNGHFVIPGFGEVPVSSAAMSDILMGCPYIDKGLKQVVEHSSGGTYQIKGNVDDLEMDSKMGIPLGYTRYTSAEKKAILFEAHFDDFMNTKNGKVPRHMVVRFEKPRLLMDIRYREIQTNVNIPWELIEVKPRSK